MINIATRGFGGFRKEYTHSREFKDFVLKCVDPIPSHRASIKMLLEHPFIKRAETLDRQKVLGTLQADFDFLNAEEEEEDNFESLLSSSQSSDLSSSKIATPPPEPAEVKVEQAHPPSEKEESELIDQICDKAQEMLDMAIAHVPRSVDEIKAIPKNNVALGILIAMLLFLIIFRKKGIVMLILLAAIVVYLAKFHRKFFKNDGSQKKVHNQKEKTN